MSIRVPQHECSPSQNGRGLSQFMDRERATRPAAAMICGGDTCCAAMQHLVLTVCLACLHPDWDPAVQGNETSWSRAIKQLCVDKKAGLGMGTPTCLPLAEAGWQQEPPALLLLVVERGCSRQCAQVSVPEGRDWILHGQHFPAFW